NPPSAVRGAPSKIAFGWNSAIVPVRRGRSRHAGRSMALNSRDPPRQPLQCDKQSFDVALTIPLESLELQPLGRSIECALGGHPSLVALGALVVLLGCCR